MALKILLADDSMTAQNMGKKILTEAGYEVIAVSNGAAAVKKIAEHKPGLVVADVYMPGYSGLEVCERVKNAQETAKTPVILTVGKMEPFKAEDGQRVRADGLIVKPFEASDLLAAVRKIEQKLAMMAPPPPPPETVKIAVPEEFKDESYEEWKVTADAEHAAVAETPAKFEVPQDMAAAPAFDMDSMLGSEPPSAAEALPAFEASSVSEVELPPLAPEPAPELVETEQAPVSSEPLPEYKVMTVAEEMKLVQTTRDPAFEATVMEAGTVADLPPAEIDPALVTDSAEMQQFTTKFGVEGEVEPVVVGLASEMPGLYADAGLPTDAPLDETQDVSMAAAQVTGRTGDTQDISESLDKVLEEPPPLQTELPAAEMSAFEMPADLAPAPEPEPLEAVLEVAPGPLAEAPGLDTQALQQFAEAVAEIPAEPAPPEPEPVLEIAPEPILPAPLPGPEAAPQVASIEHEMARAFAQVETVVEEAAVPQVAAMAAAVGGSVQQVAGDAAITLDDETLGHIVSTVVERLKPELIAEIKRKLADKK